MKGCFYVLIPVQLSVQRKVLQKNNNCYLYALSVFYLCFLIFVMIVVLYITCGTTQYFHYITYNTSVFLQIYSISKMSHIRVHFHFFLSSAPSLTSLSAARDNAKSKLFFDQKSLSHSCSLARQR